MGLPWCWSKIKAILRKHKVRNYFDLVKTEIDAVLKVTEEAIYNWFAHCCY